MARPTPPAHILAARGRKITLIDGTTPSVLFTFSSVMQLEEDFGSIGGAVQALGGIDSTDEIKGEAFGAIAKLLAAGLEHEVDVEGAPLSNIDTLRYLLDPQELQNYSDAIGEAFAAAFPAQDDEPDADPTKGAASSRGQSGTTSAPSSSDEQTQSSGA